MTCYHKTQLIYLISLGSMLSGCIAPGSLSPASVQTTAAGSPNGAMTPISSVLGLERYYPLKRTFTWTYRVTQTGSASTKVTQNVTRIDTMTEAGGTKSATYLDTQSENGIITAIATGSILETSTSLTIAGSGGSETIALPLQAGRDWTSGVLSAHTFAVDVLTVQGRRYKDVIGISYTKDNEVRAVRWLAPGYGIVKQVAKIVQNGEPYTLTSELVSALLSSVTAVSLTPGTLTISRGATASVNAQVSFDDGSISREYEFSTSPEGFVSVAQNGVATAGQATGSVTLTARSTQDATKYATASLTVN